MLVTEIKGETPVKLTEPLLSGHSKNAIVLDTFPHFNPEKYYMKLFTFAKNGRASGETTIPIFKTALISALPQARGLVLVRKRLEYKLSHLETTLTCSPHFKPKMGTDPEIFVTDGKGKTLPAFEFMDAPAKVKNYETNRAYWDGFQAEFTTRPGHGHCLAYICDDIRWGLKETLEKARAKYKDAQLTLDPVVEIEEEILKKADEKYVAFGCNPSLNFYEAKGLPITNPRNMPMRFAGGHIHFGATKPNKNIVAGLDAFTGIAFVSLLRDFENPIRRQYYGLAGEYRLPNHGLEYRTPGNGWMCHPAIFHLSFELARASYCAAAENCHVLLKGYDPEKVQAIINGCDVEGAVKFLKENEKLYKALLKSWLGNYDSSGVDRTFKVLCEGAGSVVKEPKNLEKNWMLGKGLWTSHSEGENCHWTKAVLNLSDKPTL